LADTAPVEGDLAAFDYVLPPDRIAQEPADPRDAARLLVVDRRSHTLRDARIADLGRYLRAGDCLVVNDTRVLPARVPGRVGGRRSSVRRAAVPLGPR
jgi:S-adenosylmethionine:tRNA ribosyltransferase-isomerase